MNAYRYEVECWRGRWFYKFGSCYSGPFVTRQAAANAAEKDLASPGIRGD